MRLLKHWWEESAGDDRLALCGQVTQKKPLRRNTKMPPSPKGSVVIGLSSACSRVGHDAC